MSHIRCDNCYGKVSLMIVPGRMFNFEPGVSIEIPENEKLLTCGRCLDTYLNLNEATHLEELLLPRLLASQAEDLGKIVDLLEKREQVTRGAIARACGVTENHLLKVVRGEARASLTLRRLLEAYVSCPFEFQRYMRSSARHPRPPPIVGETLGEYRIRCGGTGGNTTAVVARGDSRFVVVNAYTQFGFGGAGVQVDYDAVASAFARIAHRYGDLRIGYPRIGAGLAGGDWGLISELIDGALGDIDHTLVEFHP